MKIKDKYLNDFKSGRESALQYYINIYGKALRFFAYSIVRDKEQAEEIVSDSFFKLWKGREKVQKELNIKAFLYLTTRNSCIDYIKLSKLHTSYDINEVEDIIESDDDILANIMRVELIQLIVSELNQFPTQQAEIFKLTYLDGFSADEISIKLNTTLSNVYFARSKVMSGLKMKLNKKKGLWFLFITLFF